MKRRCDAISKRVTPNFDDVTVQITLRPIFDDVTLCKHLTAEENAFIVFNSSKKHVILAINIVIVQIAISITSLPSGTGFYVMRWVKYGGW